MPGKSTLKTSTRSGFAVHGGEKPGGISARAGASPAGENGSCGGAETDSC